MPAIACRVTKSWRAIESHAMLLHLDFSKSGAADSQLSGSCTPLEEPVAVAHLEITRETTGQNNFMCFVQAAASAFGHKPQ